MHLHACRQHTSACIQFTSAGLIYISTKSRAINLLIFVALPTMAMVALLLSKAFPGSIPVQLCGLTVYVYQACCVTTKSTSGCSATTLYTHTGQW